MDMTLSAEERAFQLEVRDFLSKNLPERLRRISRLTPGIFVPMPDYLEWQAKLREKGWLTYNLPREDGGTGWSPVMRYIFERECAAASAPHIGAQGLKMLAPVLCRFGTQEQKRFFLPRIESAEHIWCQGYSEPQAGSDLASLRTKATLDGDAYIVDGTKIWTTNAHLSNWMFCLARTNAAPKPQNGISFLMIDMKSPGISISPIKLISGDCELNQVFFDSVRVPAGNRIGEEGQGWTIAKFLLEHERGGSCQAPGLLTAIAELRARVGSMPGRGGRSLAEDGDFMHRLAMLEIEARGMEMLELRLLVDSASPGPQTAVLGLLMANIRQGIDVLLLEAFGARSLELSPHRPVDAFDRLPMPSYLNNRAWSIMGGSNEIMRNIIAKAVLKF